MRSKVLWTVSLIGVSWALIGIGYQTLVINYIPQGGALTAVALGLFLAGSLSGALFLRALERLSTSFERILLTLGYLMFSPVGVMVGVAVPGSLEPIGGGSWLAFFLGAPVLIVLTGTVALLVGLFIAGGLAVAAQRVNTSLEGGR